MRLCRRRSPGCRRSVLKVTPNALHANLRPLQPSSLTPALLAGGGGVEEGPETSSRKPQLGGGPPEPRPGGGGAAEGPAEQHEAAEQGERVQEEPGGAD